MSSKGFFKSEDHAGHTVPIPDRTENSVPKPGRNHKNNAVLFLLYCLVMSLNILQIFFYFYVKTKVTRVSVYTRFSSWCVTISSCSEHTVMTHRVIWRECRTCFSHTQISSISIRHLLHLLEYSFLTIRHVFSPDFSMHIKNLHKTVLGLSLKAVQNSFFSSS